MRFSAEPMFAGDLFDAADRFAGNESAQSSQDGAAESAWRQALAMGWPMLLVDEERGGAGGTLADLGAVIEACSREALALPLVRRCAWVPALLMGAASPAADATLRAMGAGEIDVDAADGSQLQIAFQPGGSVRLEGLLQQVDLEIPFSHCLIMVAGRLLLLPAEVLPAPVARHVGIDGVRRSDVQIAGLLLPSSVVLQQGPQAVAAADAAADLATVATAIEIAATLGAAVEHCIEHLSTRHQFGVALATFQVLRHHVVDLYVQYESASVLLARLVNDTVTSGRLARRDAALCKLYLNNLARRSSEMTIQLHGGMGMTAELPAARLARRLLCAEFENGNRHQLLERLQHVTQAAAAHT